MLAGPYLAAKAHASQLQNVGAFGNWTLYCHDKVTNADDCALAQAVTDAVDPRIAVQTSVAYLSSGQLQMSIHVQPSAVPTEPIALMVDDLQAALITPDACDNKGCSTRISISFRLWGMISAAKRLDIQYRFEKKQGTSLALELSGLSEGVAKMYDRLGFKANLLASAYATSQTSTGVFSVALVTGVPWGETWGLPPEACTTALLPKPADYQSIPMATVSFVGDGQSKKVMADDGSLDTIRKMASATRDCGDFFRVEVKAAPDSARLVPEGVLAIQQTKVTEFLKSEGGSADKFVVFDAATGFDIRQPN